MEGTFCTKSSKYNEISQKWPRNQLSHQIAYQKHSYINYDLDKYIDYSISTAIIVLA